MDIRTTLSNTALPDGWHTLPRTTTGTPVLRVAVSDDQLCSYTVLLHTGTLSEADLIDGLTQAGGVVDTVEQIGVPPPAGRIITGRYTADSTTMWSQIIAWRLAENAFSQHVLTSTDSRHRLRRPDLAWLAQHARHLPSLLEKDSDLEKS